MNDKSSLLSLAAALALGLGLILACSSSTQNRRSGSNSSRNSGSSAPIPVTALALASAYDDNEVAADQQYEGKVLLVSGKVESINKVFGSMSVTLQGKEMSFVGVQCFVDASEEAAVARLKKGTQATVQGTCDGKSLNVELKDCTIK